MPPLKIFSPVCCCVFSSHSDFGAIFCWGLLEINREVQEERAGRSAHNLGISSPSAVQLAKPLPLIPSSGSPVHSHNEVRPARQGGPYLYFYNLIL